MPTVEYYTNARAHRARYSRIPRPVGKIAIPTYVGGHMARDNSFGYDEMREVGHWYKQVHDVVSDICRTWLRTRVWRCY
jgi:hypothetical protein